MANFPRQGTALVDFARKAVEILLANPLGVDQSLFMYEYYGGNPPSDTTTWEFQWGEFKRAKDYSHQMFKDGIDGWVWIRARHGKLPHQFFYQAVARITGGEPEIVIRYPISEALLIDKEGDWYTRTESHMRVTVANIKAKQTAALQTGNTRLTLEAEAALDEVIFISPRLAAINFDIGITVQDLKILANSSKVPRLLQKSVKRALHSVERSSADLKKLSEVVYRVKQMRKAKP